MSKNIGTLQNKNGDILCPDIVEVITNDNGTAIKFANGIMLQYTRIQGNTFNCQTNPANTYYYVDTNNAIENTKVWYYPIEFINTNIIGHVEVSSSAYTMCSIGYVQRSRMAGYCCSPYSLKDTIWTWHFLAIGYWK